MHVHYFWSCLLFLGVRLELVFFYGDVEVAGSEVICVVNDYDDAIGYGWCGWKEIDG